MINIKVSQNFSKQQMQINIRPLTERDDLSTSVEILQKAFLPVAKRFSLTKDNAPTNAAFIEKSKLFDSRNKGADFFGAFNNELQVGFIAIYQLDDNVFSMEKLSVIPEFAKHGIGTRLVEFAVEQVRKHNAKKISIGVINDNHELIEWYKKLGFEMVGQKKYDHLPFLVCFMEKILNCSACF